MQNHQIHYTLLKNIATHSKPRKAHCLCRFPGFIWLSKSMNPPFVHYIHLDGFA